MSGTWGECFRLTIYGESHGEGIGIVLDGLPAGIPLNEDAIRRRMARRAPGGSLATARKEPDIPQILSGVFNGRTAGTPLCMLIRNTDARPSAYEPETGAGRIFRPGHADYTGHVKYGGYNDYRGGGHFSGRLTAGLVFAGEVALQALRHMGRQVMAVARIVSLGGISDPTDPEPFFAGKMKSPEDLAAWAERMKADDIPVLDTQAGEAMRQCIRETREAGDSVGGIIEGRIIGAEAGWGEPFFRAVESVLSGLLFAIPAVKGVSFGLGFETADRKGSEVNDSLRLEAGQVVHATNRGGGIQGGIANGMPVVFQVSVRPTPTVFLPQETVCLQPDGSYEQTTATAAGRHDPCIVPRAVPVVEAVAAIACLELFLSDKSCREIRTNGR